MPLPFAIVCYLDILGFSDMVLHDVETDDRKYLPSLTSAIQSVKHNLNTGNLEVRQFSDSIMVATRYTGQDCLTLVAAVKAVQREFVLGDMLIRGGIALGRHYLNGEVVFSQGLIEAYRLEVSVARAPRVVVDKQILALLEGTGVPWGTQVDEIAPMLCVDSDSEYFIDYLGLESLKEHADAIRRMLQVADLGKPGILEKYQWLATYHNYKAAELRQQPEHFDLPAMRPAVSGLRTTRQLASGRRT